MELPEYLLSESTSRAHLEQSRWGGNPICPFCGEGNPYKTSRGFKCRSKSCYKKFSVTVGTKYEGSKLPIKTWLLAEHILGEELISSYELSRRLMVTQKSAWYLRHKIVSDYPELAQVNLVIDSARQLKLTNEEDVGFRAAVCFMMLLFLCVDSHIICSKITGYDLGEVRLFYEKWRECGVLKDGNLYVEKWENDTELAVIITLHSLLVTGEVMRLGTKWDTHSSTSGKASQ